MAESQSIDIPIIRIEPSKGWVSLKLGELWEYRERQALTQWDSRRIKVVMRVQLSTDAGKSSISGTVVLTSTVETDTLGCRELAYCVYFCGSS